MRSVQRDYSEKYNRRDLPVTLWQHIQSLNVPLRSVLPILASIIFIMIN
jgi:hypothetical protein